MRHLLKYVAILSLSVLFFGCLQGPWEYVPDDKSVFRGLTVNAYVLNGRPIRQVCFEKLNAFDESITQSFPFYDSAYVTITGDGGRGTETILLTARKERPSCFEGRSDFIVKAGELYQLNATIVWDSAGKKVSTYIQGSTVVPKTWAIEKTARGSAKILSGALVTSNGYATMLERLPESVANEILALYFSDKESVGLDSNNSFLRLNRARIANSIDSLLVLQTKLVNYSTGDTILYLDGILNLSSHFFKAQYSNDIKSVLVTQKYSENAINPSTRFDNITSSFRELVPADFYSAGTVRRLQLISLVEGVRNGLPFNIFDAIPVNNAYLKGGINTIYFYAADKNYTDFVETYINNHQSANVTPLNSVVGGQGFFAGLNPDSFVVNVRIPPQVLSFSTLEARADYCAQKSWDNADCRKFEPVYCSKVQYNDQQYAFENPDIIKVPQSRNPCLAEAVVHYLMEGKSISFLVDSLLIDKNRIEWNVRNSDGSISISSITYDAQTISEAQVDGLLRFCIRTDFKDPICIELSKSCFDGQNSNECLQSLYTWCVDNDWNPDGGGCVNARVRYCSDTPGAPAALCRD